MKLNWERMVVIMDAIGEGVTIGVTSSVINSAIKESGIIPKLIKGAKLAITKSNPLMTLGFAGMSIDTPAKVSASVGMGSLIVGVVVTNPVVIKVSLATAMSCFSFGFVRGIRRAWKEV